MNLRPQVRCGRKPLNAQQLGQERLSPMRPVCLYWRASRELVYVTDLGYSAP
jgi:hypothetical protein